MSPVTRTGLKVCPIVILCRCVLIGGPFCTWFYISSKDDLFGVILTQAVRRVDLQRRDIRLCYEHGHATAGDDH